MIGLQGPCVIAYRTRIRWVACIIGKPGREMSASLVPGEQCCWVMFIGAHDGSERRCGSAPMQRWEEKLLVAHADKRG